MRLERRETRNTLELAYSAIQLPDEADAVGYCSSLLIHILQIRPAPSYTGGH